MAVAAVRPAHPNRRARGSIDIWFHERCSTDVLRAVLARERELFGALAGCVSMVVFSCKCLWGRVSMRCSGLAIQEVFDYFTVIDFPLISLLDGTTKY